MKEISVFDLEMKPVYMFSKNWGALTSGNEKDGFNAMAIAWGSVGVLWEHEGRQDKPVPICNVYVMTQRYTHHLLEENDWFTVSFLGEEHRKSVGYIGTYSGADDPNKIETAGLSIVRDGETAYMEDRDLVLICRKILHQKLDRACADPQLMSENYNPTTTRIHDMFTGEIMKVLVKE